MENLTDFIKAAKANGATDEFLVNLLRERGWPAKRIYAVLGEHYAAATGVSIPDAPGRLESAREAFLYFLVFATLSTWLWAIGSIWYTLIAAWFPDPTQRYGSLATFTAHQISWEMASIIVAFPAFVWVGQAVISAISRNPEKAGSGVRRWLANFALLISSLIVIGDFICFLNYFLQGGITQAFVWKSVIVFVLAAGAFAYYTNQSKTADSSSRRWQWLFSATGAIAITLTLTLGFGTTGSPQKNRLYNQDDYRLSDLYQISSRLENARVRKPADDKTRDMPPTDLSTFAADASTVTTDKFTNQPYEYHPLTGSKYELCATFDLPSRPEPNGGAHSNNPQAAFWQHPAGHHCFTLDLLTPAPYFYSAYLPY